MRPSSEPPAGPWRAVVGAPSRAMLFAGLTVVLLANAMARDLAPEAWLQGMGYSWAFWLAIVLTLRLATLAARRPAAEPADAADHAVALGLVLCSLVPSPHAASVAASALGAWTWLRARGDPELRGAAMILIALSFTLIWIKLLLLIFAMPLEWLDARLVALMRGAEVHGNIVGFIQGSGTMTVRPNCTSVQNASMAILLWLSLVRTIRPAARRAELMFGALVFGTVMAINLVRLGLMAESYEMYLYWHGPTGAGIANGLITASAIAWAAITVRRELFR